MERLVLNKVADDLDYVKFYAEKMKLDSFLFSAQKILIESQMKSSKDLFRNGFGSEKSFKRKAREYLKSFGLLK